MLPGQSCDCSTAIASAAIRRGGTPIVCATCSRKYCTSSGMSSRRSASDGHADRHHRQAVEQILAELPVGDRLGEVAAGRGDDAHVDLDPRRRRRRAGNSGRPARAGSWPGSPAACRRLRRDRACRRAPLRARRPGAAGRRSPSTPNSSLSMLSGVIVGALRTTNGPSARTDWAWISRAASSLPEPGGPEISTRELAGPSRSMMRLQVGDRRRSADHAIGGAGACAQLADFAPQPRRLQRALDDEDQPVGLERLLDEVVGAELDRGDRGFDVAVAGDHHHRHVAVLLLDHFQQLQAVEPRALHPDVEQHQMRPARLDRRQRLVGIARKAASMALVRENAGDELADVVLVVDDQDIGGHQDGLSCAKQPGARQRRPAKRSRRRRRSAAATSSAPARRAPPSARARPSSSSTSPW